MTILNVCQEAAIDLNQPIPASVFGSNVQFARELALHANRVAAAMAKAHDWRTLTTLGTLTGDGSTKSFSFPTDYDRMPKKANVHSKSWQNAAFSPTRDLDHWLYLNDTGLNGTPGTWVLLGGSFQVTPAMAVGETARFYYQSNNLVLDENGVPKPFFTADTDTFRLSERVLSLGMTRRWRAKKSVDFGDELNEYAIALAEEIGKDKGARQMAIGRPRMLGELAYQGILGGPGAPNWATNGPPMTFDEE